MVVVLKPAPTFIVGRFLVRNLVIVFRLKLAFESGRRSVLSFPSCSSLGSDKSSGWRRSPSSYASGLGRTWVVLILLMRVARTWRRYPVISNWSDFRRGAIASPYWRHPWATVERMRYSGCYSSAWRAVVRIDDASWHRLLRLKRRWLRQSLGTRI